MPTLAEVAKRAAESEVDVRVELVEVDGLSDDVLKNALKALKPGGALSVEKVSGDRQKLEDACRLAGFVDVSTSQEEGLVARRPKYSIGAKMVLPWAAADQTADNDEIIDENELLADEDLPVKEPVQRTRGAGGRKPCANCSCGLKEQLENSQETAEVKTEEAASKCGNCHLGDGFRCASCPYLGLPPFKPGEKVSLTDSLMTSDL
mmetsp:Transcript_293/g.955  ORF Transcript_293/g.955 Transcript_293/m.955 type:complete len:206 (-) Transcript_293:865-1482(-)